ncbi:MAG TPA: kelch repeat-containing protein [Planctomycetota bacterium]|nr:kelch repeat-containing protein [Planctomycetota bacterium]
MSTLTSGTRVHPSDRQVRPALRGSRGWLAGAMLLGLTGAAAAQGLGLDVAGGGLGQVMDLRVQGQPGEFYVILFDFQEQVNPIPALGITLAVSDAFVGFSLGLPGFVGNTNAGGAATASLLLPNDAWLASQVVSLQAVAGNGAFRTSNLLRVTPQQPGTWKPTLAQPTLPIAGGTAVAMANGELLFVGGSGPTAQLYKSRTEQWELAGVTFGVGLLSQSTDLADGRVLFTGGLDLATGQPTNAAAIYDPATQSTTTVAMLSPRAGHGASRMGNGRVLITGGLASFDLQNPLAIFNGIQATTEVFDPATGTFVPGPNMLEARAMHTSTTLTNGQVLIAGGLTLIPIVNVPTVSATAYKFNPATNSFGLPSTFSGARFLHSAAALSDGKVLIAGGLSLDLTSFLLSGNVQDLSVGTRSDCQLYSPSLFGFGTFATVNGLQEGRAGAAIAALPNGGALIAGGFAVTLDPATATFGLGATATADRFAQGPNSLVPTGSMAAPRLFPNAVNLPDGTVLVVGGGPAIAEVYQR